MSEIAWACRINLTNQAAIASEDPKFDKDAFRRWLEDHYEDPGYFIRDPGYAFDCRYMSDAVFEQIYIFENGDENTLFRRIIRKASH